MDDIRPELADIAAVGEAAEGYLRLELNALGELTDVVLDPKVKRLPADEIAAAFKEAHAAATAALRGLVADAMTGAPIADTDRELTEAAMAIEQQLRASAQRTDMLLDTLRRMGG